MNDLKFAFRQLVKNPGFTAVVPTEGVETAQRFSFAFACFCNCLQEGMLRS